MQIIPAPSSGDNYAEIYDTTDGTVIYVGMAAKSAAAASAVWRIQKYSVSGAVITMTWADGNDLFDNVWNNRSSLTYS